MRVLSLAADAGRRTAAVAAACALLSPLGADAQRAGADSLRLARTPCYGTCPAYAITITAAGRVTFLGRSPLDTAMARDSVAPAVFDSLVARAASIGFSRFPDVIARDLSLCPLNGTDLPSAIVTIFAGQATKQVVDDHGCFLNTQLGIAPSVARLRAFEMRIDSALGTARFVQAARVRGPG